MRPEFIGQYKLFNVRVKGLMKTRSFQESLYNLYIHCNY